MKTISFSILCVFLLTGSSVAQNRSVYTSTRTDGCRTIKSTAEGTGSYVGECRGVGGYKLRLIEGDIRQTIDIITPARKKFELNFWNYHGSFSAIGEKVEWRTKRGVLVALIARYRVADPTGEKPGTSYLMISKIGRSESCVTDIALPGSRHNEVARLLADAAKGKSCKVAAGN